MGGTLQKKGLSWCLWCGLGGSGLQPQARKWPLGPLQPHPTDNLSAALGIQKRKPPCRLQTTCLWSRQPHRSAAYSASPTWPEGPLYPPVPGSFCSPRLPLLIICFPLELRRVAHCLASNSKTVLALPEEWISMLSAGLTTPFPVRFAPFPSLATPWLFPSALEYII